MPNPITDNQIRQIKAYLSLKSQKPDQAFSYEIVSLLSMMLDKYQQAKGDKGDTGLQGIPGKDSTVPGPKGDKGDVGQQGPQGRQGPQGLQGIEGKPGKDGKDGLNGLDGEDASPEDVAKILKKDKKFLESVKGEKGDRGPQGNSGTITQRSLIRTGGSLEVYDESTPLGQGIRKIYFSGSGVTATRAGDGVVIVSVAGGGAGTSVETPTGTVDGSNTTFTVANTPQYIVVDGATYFENNGYTLVGLTITTTVPPVDFIRSFY